MGASILRVKPACPNVKTVALVDFVSMDPVARSICVSVAMFGRVMTVPHTVNVAASFAQIAMMNVSTARTRYVATANGTVLPAAL